MITTSLHFTSDMTTPRCCQLRTNMRVPSTSSCLPVWRSWYQSARNRKRCYSHQRQSSHSVQVLARNHRYDDDSVDIDEEDSWSSQARNSAGLVPSIAGPILLAANGLSNRLTDIAFDLAPDTIERGTVEIAVKAALVLVAVSIAKSLLGVALTVGTVVFGIYVATKFWSKQQPEGPARNRAQRQPKRQRHSRRQDDDGLSDVWFESKPGRKSSKSSQEDPFW